MATVNGLRKRLGPSQVRMWRHPASEPKFSIRRGGRQSQPWVRSKSYPLMRNQESHYPALVRILYKSRPYLYMLSLKQNASKLTKDQGGFE